MSRHIHFIGIGGIGMSGIARILLRKGIKISGSDLKESRIISELRSLGAVISIGHKASNIKGADSVVYSSAIKEDSPELLEARRNGITVIKRAQALAELMRDKQVITVSGSHGKTTTTSLASFLLSEAGLHPTAAIGGILRNIDANTYFGNGRFFVAEADESDGSFLYYNPRYSIITNLDREHLDYYRNFDNEIDAFRQFIGKTRGDGCLFCSGDDINLKNILKEYKNRYILFGLDNKAHIFPRNIQINKLSSRFDCFYAPSPGSKAEFIDRFNLNLAGMHNISNALAVIALGIELGIDTPVIKKSLANYKGTGRRIEVKFDDRGYLVIDDYAHHPTEIEATLKAVKNIESRRVIAVFQPHRYSRTKLLLDEFARSFDLADYTIITDIYPADEPALEGVSARHIYDKIKEYFPGKYVNFMPKEELVSHILKIIKPNDLVLTLGAGDIVKTCDELVGELRRRSL